MMNESYYHHPHVDAQLFPSYEAALDGAFGLGSAFEDNLRRIFAAIPGASGAYDNLVGLIQEKAKAGALQAVPEIKRQVENTVKPYVFAAMLLGLGGFLFGISTYLQNRRA